MGLSGSVRSAPDPDVFGRQHDVHVVRRGFAAFGVLDAARSESGMGSDAGLWSAPLDFENVGREVSL